MRSSLRPGRRPNTEWVFTPAKDQYVLAEISPNLDLTIDYGFVVLYAPIYWLLRQIDSFINNYGFSIITDAGGQSSVLQIDGNPIRSMAGMRRVMPKMESLKETYGDDRMKLQQATMELYERRSIRLVDACRCWFRCRFSVALYWVLLESVELRHAAFGLWLQDLSVRTLLYPASADGGDHVPANSLSPTPAVLYRPES